MGRAHRARVPLFALGGTIASTSVAGRPGADVALTGEDLVRAVPALQAMAELEVHTFRQVPSGDLTMADVLELAAAIAQEVAAGADGVVVTQGTDTLEEVAFALDLLLTLDVPVVVTGAMRGPSLPGADGPANLLGAVTLAASPDAAGMGVLVVFNDEVHAARFVRKRYTTSTATFGSPLVGPIGQVLEGQARIYMRPLARVTVRLPDKPRPAVVALVPIMFDDTGTLLNDSTVETSDGLVIAAFGGGHVPRRLVPRLREIANSIPVVVASRTFAGEMLRAVYGYPGGELDLRASGLVFAGAYDAVHARVLLQLLLMAGSSRETIKHVLDRGLTTREPISVEAAS